ncbi:hypothetical protein D0860_07386 [Hortaea werneckii]|uniref:Protein kinase domain-containing protein n=1 Tax=Hortaea werneckii TaxID=91943 RepID=A0A3M7GLG8_HORWE|nr:hypothetical protein D0860_07386 [Hortaea werneckii]
MKLGYMEVGSAPEQWNFVKSLGRGTYGRACLWVKRDNSHNIIDRAVIKESSLSRKRWEDNWNWWTIRLDRGRRSIVQFRNYRVFPELAMFRLYMEFGSGGTLNDLIERHARIRDTKAADGKRLKPKLHTHTLRMVSLRGDGKGSMPDEVRQRHSFRSPYLAKTCSSRHQARKQQLGDFGMMVREDIKGYKNPSKQINMGTELYCAPEQLSTHTRRKNLYKHKVTPAADVFAIGKVVLCMMQLWNDTTNRSPPVKIDYEPYGFPDELERRYGQELVVLVRECMRPRPRKRISPENLLFAIQERVNSLEDIEDEGTPTPLKFQLPGPEEYLSENRDLYELLSR